MSTVLVEIPDGASVLALVIIKADGTAAVVVRDGEALAVAFVAVADILREDRAAPGDVRAVAGRAFVGMAAVTGVELPTENGARS